MQIVIEENAGQFTVTVDGQQKPAETAEAVIEIVTEALGGGNDMGDFQGVNGLAPPVRDRSNQQQAWNDEVGRG